MTVNVYTPEFTRSFEAAAVFLCAHFIVDSSTELTIWSDRIVPLVMDLFVFGGFTLVWLVGKLRKKL